MDDKGELRAATSTDQIKEVAVQWETSTRGSDTFSAVAVRVTPKIAEVLRAKGVSSDRVENLTYEFRFGLEKMAEGMAQINQGACVLIDVINGIKVAADQADAARKEAPRTGFKIV